MITVITQIILFLTTGLIKVSIVCEMALDEKLSTKEHSDYLVYYVPKRKPIFSGKWGLPKIYFVARK